MQSKRFFPVLLTLAFLLPPFTHAAPSDPAQDLVSLVEHFTHAQSSFDVPALTALTAENYVEVSPVGDIDPRDKMLGFYAPEHKMEGVSVTVQEPQVRFFGDIAIVIARIDYEIKSPDKTIHPNPMRATFVAHSTPDGWKLVSAQYTGFRPAPAQGTHD